MMRALDLLLKFGSFLAMVLSVAVMMGWIDVPDSRAYRVARRVRGDVDDQRD